jgi:hypothetical protein
VNEWLHDLRNFAQLILEIRIKDFCIKKPVRLGVNDGISIDMPDKCAYL